jgi:hypothetical protein
MFSRRLHPTPSGFAFGLAVIALWALIWIWFFAQLSPPRPAAVRKAVAGASMPPGGRALDLAFGKAVVPLRPPARA